MSNRNWLLVCLLGLILVGVISPVLWRKSPPIPHNATSPPEPAIQPAPVVSPPQRAQKREPTAQIANHVEIGEEILKDYLSPATSVREDLTLVSHLLTSFDTLVKASDALPLGANGDIADALRGRNSVQMRFLPDRHKAFNEDGEIIDRWQTPLYFHAESSDRIALRSAGPDQTMWTSDDVHLEPNGRAFADQGALLPSSLYKSE